MSLKIETSIENKEDENTPKVWPKKTAAPAHQPNMLATADQPQNFVGK